MSRFTRLIVRNYDRGVSIAAAPNPAEARARANILVAKNPSFYNMEYDGNTLWCKTDDPEVIRPIQNWVLYNKGNEPE
jgi:hypothetical protein